MPSEDVPPCDPGSLESFAGNPLQKWPVPDTFDWTSGRASGGAQANQSHRFYFGEEQLLVELQHQLDTSGLELDWAWSGKTSPGGTSGGGTEDVFWPDSTA